MSEIKLTKAQHHLMYLVAEAHSEGSGLILNPKRNASCRVLVRKGLVHIAGRVREQPVVRLTDLGLAYCKKHFTTTEQP